METTFQLLMRTSRNVPSRLTAIVVAGGLAGACSAPSNTPAVQLAELVPVATHGVSTDIILPPYRGSTSLLTEGWEDISADDRQEGLWIVGTMGSFRFYAAVEGSGVLEAEGMTMQAPHDSQTPDDPQILQVDLNGARVHREAMPAAWTKYEFPLPAEHVQVGWNVVTFKFNKAIRPLDLDAESADARPLAARFRRLRVHSPYGRGLWAERPSAVEVARIAGDREDRFEVTMPTDSMLDFYVLPRGDTMLRGSVGAVLTDQSGAGELWASIELVEESGQTHQLLEYDHGASPGVRRFEIDLRAWNDQPIQVVFRCWGRANGTVHWSDVTLSTPPDPTVSMTRLGHLMVPPRSGRLGRPDIIIMLDAARADAFGERAPPTPGADGLASDGTRFRKALAPAPWTGLSVPALLTGRFPGSIGAEVWGSQIPAGIPTLPELLQEVGYHTVVWSQHNIYEGNQSLRRGLEEVLTVRSNVLADRSLLPKAADLFVNDHPTFAFVHLLPPHGPYDPPAPFEGTLSDWYTGDFPSSAAALNRAARPDGRKPTDEDVRYLRARYDENVAFADDLIQRLLRMIREAGRYQDALIVLTSDHGEGFFEHGYFLHTRRLYDEFLRVPFIVKWPAGSPGFPSVVDQDVSLVDVVPTLVDGLALDRDFEGFQGRTLLPLVFDGVPLDRAMFAHTRGFARRDATPQPARALFAGQYKLILSDTPEQVQLFNLASDPSERHDLSGTEAFRTRLLLQNIRLQQLHNTVALSQHVQQPDEPLDPDTIRNLRALGYIR